MKKYVIGIDVGTTCTKVVVIDQLGNIAGQGSSGYRLISCDDRIEQNAQDWIEAVCAGIRQATNEIDKTRICGISCSTQGGSTVAVDKDGSFLGNAWTWMDRRSAQQVQQIDRLLGEEYVYRTTGSRISPSLDAAKIRNMKTLPEYAEAKLYLTTLEVVNRFLTGRAAIDPSNAAMRQLLNIDRISWDEKMLEVAGLSTEELPELLLAGQLVGALTAAASEATGLPEGIPVYNGAHDQYCASIGAGAIQSGDMLLSAGTTWVLMGITDKPMYTDSFIVPGRHPIDGLYGAIASLVGSGASMEWYRKNLMSADYDSLNQTVPDRKQSTRELFFFPYLNGAPYPIHNKDAKGVFAGLTLQHDPYDLARALMEGVAFGVRRAVEDFERNGAKIHSIVMMGGASKSPAWMQMIASITSIPIKQLSCTDACAVGAAIIAACGAGMFQSYGDAADAIVSVAQVYQPDAQEQEYYDAKFQQFDRLWSALSQFYKGDH